jgi:predicted protein tyrosine phosphatase
MFNLKITDLHTAQDIIKGRIREFNPTKILSLVDDAEVIRQIWKSKGNHHKVIYMDDISRPMRGYTLPTLEHIIDGLDHFRDIQESDTVLIHCHAGISRSTAFAILVLIQYGLSIEDAIQHVITIRPIAYPNELVIELGDEYFNLDTRLINAVENLKTQKRGFSLV